MAGDGTTARQLPAAAGVVDAEPRVGRRLDVRGTVQGVGFRPFVYRLATELGVDGSVRNCGGHVVINAVADEWALEELTRRLASDAPPLARIQAVSAGLLTVPRDAIPGFHIENSEATSESGRDLPPDVAPCDDCLAEMLDPTDRRFRYPFVNCTNCGPRATIVDDLPYDRSRTAMRTFAMCDECRREYEDPLDRRFHAEPIACPACGPALSWGDAVQGKPTGSAALLAAEAEIAGGAIVAVKGLGGYQLVCDATRADAVGLLRDLKHRLTKPLAVMVADLASAREIAELTDAEVRLLTSPERPIVLATAISPTRLVDSVHPGSNRVGLFLPNTPLHYLLLADLARPIVVTSGNVADEPMAIDDGEAATRLGGTVAGVLRHDRPIRTRYDDSVVQVVGSRPQLLRRARGYAPEPRTLPIAAGAPLLAVGAELKHTFTFAERERAVTSPHIGDLENAEAFDSFMTTIDHLARIVAITPELVAHDLHPAYLSTRFAQTWPAERRMGVQHHHAHVAACAAEFGISHPFIGVAYDGLGMGDDGTLWGGEVLVADLESYRRVGRFALAPLPGGAAAVRRPARMALGYLFGAESFESAQPQLRACDARATVADILGRLDEREVSFVERMVATKFNCPQASSAGRLFDAVASLLGLGDDATFEGEAAIALENAATPGRHGELPWTLRQADELWVYDVRPTLRGVVDAARGGQPTGVVAARFHETVVAVTAALCAATRDATGLQTVCLSGGVFQNRLLATQVDEALRAAGFEVHLGEQVPPNDGGISFGQAAIAAARTGRS
jgi:hydrogenase maturation protein HypF